MNSSCERHGLLCTCVDWKKAELPAMVNHLLRHFRFLRYELRYGTLASEEGRELCMIGQCARCGNQLCYGTVLPAEVSTDTFLAAVYRWAYQARNVVIQFDDPTFRDMFVSLFHEEDRAFVRAWLQRPENQSAGQMYRHDTKKEV